MSASEERVNTLLRENDYSNNPSLFSIESFTPTFTKRISDSTLRYCPSLEIIICSDCKVNLYTSTTTRHLNEKHKDIPKVKLKTLKKAIEALTTKTFTELTETIKSDEYYFKELRVSYTGYKCSRCEFITIYKRHADKHFRKKHFFSKFADDEDTEDPIISRVPIITLTDTLELEPFYFILLLPVPI